jgi:hypothetical protein
LSSAVPASLSPPHSFGGPHREAPALITFGALCQHFAPCEQVARR